MRYVTSPQSNRRVDTNRLSLEVQFRLTGYTTLLRIRREVTYNSLLHVTLTSTELLINTYFVMLCFMWNILTFDIITYIERKMDGFKKNYPWKNFLIWFFQGEII